MSRKKDSLFPIRGIPLLYAVSTGLLSMLGICVFMYVRTGTDIFLSERLDGRSLMITSLSFRGFLFFLPLALSNYILLCKAKTIRASGIIVSALFAVNMTVSLAMEHSGMQDLLLPTNIIENGLILLGFTALLYSFVGWIFYFLDRKTAYRIPLLREKDTYSNVLRFCIPFILLVVCWLPCVLMCYPGSLSEATGYQLMSWAGLKPLTSTQPVLTTVIYGLLYHLGLTADNQEKALFLCAMLQVLFNAVIMTMVCVKVKQYTRSAVWYWVTLCFYGLLPVWQNAAQLILHNVLHTGFFLLFFLHYLKCLNKKRITVRDAVLLGLYAFLVSFTGRGMIFAAALSILVLLLFKFRKAWLPLAASLASFLFVSLACIFVLFPMLHIGPEWESETYEIPLQQTALYARTHSSDMPEDDIAVINGTLDYQKIVEEYTPLTAEPVKRTFHDEDGSIADFRQFYLQLLRRQPVLFAKEAVMSTFEHLNPWFREDFYTSISHEEDFITADFSAPQQVELARRIWDAWQNIPVLRILVGTGLYAWLLIALTAYAIKEYSGKAVVGLVPMFALFVGLFLTRANGALPAGYSLIASAPLFSAWVVFAVAQRKPRKTAQDAEEEIDVKETVFSFMRNAAAAGSKFTKELKSDKVHPIVAWLKKYIPVPRNPAPHLDVLRILAIFCVLYNHSGDRGYFLFVHSESLVIQTLLLAFSVFIKIAVPLFFMVSGSLLLGRDESVKKIMLHRVAHFAVVLVLISLFYYFAYPSRPLSTLNFLDRFYRNDIQFPLWYLYSYISFLCMLPLLRAMVRNMRAEHYQWMMICHLLIQGLTVLDFLLYERQNVHTSYIFFFINQSYILYPLYGYYIDHVRKKGLTMEEFTVWTVAALIGVGLACQLTLWKSANVVPLSDDSNREQFFNIAIFLPSVFVYLMVKQLFELRPMRFNGRAILFIIGSCTFGVYLFERTLRTETMPIFNYLKPLVGSFAASLLQTFAACFIGIIAVFIYKLVWGMIKAFYTSHWGRSGEKK